MTFIDAKRFLPADRAQHRQVGVTLDSTAQFALLSGPGHPVQYHPSNPHPGVEPGVASKKRCHPAGDAGYVEHQ